MQNNNMTTFGKNAEEKIVTINMMLNNQISVQTKWNKELVEYFRTINSRKWDGVQKLWFFPSSVLEALKLELPKFGYEVKIARFQPVVTIYEKEDEYSTVQADYDPNISRLIQDLDYMTWDAAKKMWAFDTRKTEDLCNQLKEAGITFILDKVAKAKVTEQFARKQFKN